MFGLIAVMTPLEGFLGDREAVKAKWKRIWSMRTDPFSPKLRGSVHLSTRLIGSDVFQLM